jgi:hypothetical protein
LTLAVLKISHQNQRDPVALPDAAGISHNGFLRKKLETGFLNRIILSADFE